MRTERIIKRMNNLTTIANMKYSTYCRTKYNSFLHLMDGIQNKIVTTEARIRCMEEHLGTFAEKKFTELYDSVINEVNNIISNEPIRGMNNCFIWTDTDTVEKACSISELYHSMWMILKRIQEASLDCKELAQGDESLSIEQQFNLDAIQKCLYLIQEIYDTVGVLEAQLATVYETIWKNALTTLRLYESYTDFKLLVSQLPDNDLAKYRRDDVVCCNYFTSQNSESPVMSNFGFVYGIDNSLIGMSPRDSGLACVTVLDDVEDTCRLFFGGIKIDDIHYLEGVLYDFLPYYPPDEILKSAVKNEVVLSGDAKPEAIFVPKGLLADDSLKAKVRAASVLYDLPLAIYDAKQNTLDVALL